jgi:hypothetical protein
MGKGGSDQGNDDGTKQSNTHQNNKQQGKRINNSGDKLPPDYQFSDSICYSCTGIAYYSKEQGLTCFG